MVVSQHIGFDFALKTMSQGAHVEYAIVVNAAFRQKFYPLWNTGHARVGFTAYLFCSSCVSISIHTDAGVQPCILHRHYRNSELWSFPRGPAIAYHCW